MKNIDIGILINNVGGGSLEYFDEMSSESLQQVISLNIESTVWMTNIVIKGMKQRKRGAIVNIGSGYSIILMI